MINFFICLYITDQLLTASRSTGGAGDGTGSIIGSEALATAVDVILMHLSPLLGSGSSNT
jgi:hypothetical protein